MPLFPSIDKWQEERPDTLANLDSKIAEFWDKSTLSERLGIAVQLYQSAESELKNTPDEETTIALHALQQYANHFIGAVANTPVVTSSLRRQIAEKLKIDYSYLPNHLPSFLSEPKIGESHEQFIKRRLGEQLAHVAPRRTINSGEQERLFYLTTDKIDVELLPISQKEILQRIEEGATYHPGIIADVNSEQNKERQRLFDEFSILEQADFKERENYRLLPHDGKLMRFQATDKGLEFVPAETKGNITHDTKEWATFIIDAKGEMFIHSDTDTFKHSSFMSGAPVLFAGEIRIEDGKITGLTNFSGHYLPPEKALSYALTFLTDKGLDLSETVVSAFSNAKDQNFELGLAPEVITYLDKKNEAISHYVRELKEINSLISSKQLSDRENKKLIALRTLLFAEQKKVAKINSLDSLKDNAFLLTKVDLITKIRAELAAIRADASKEAKARKSELEKDKFLILSAKNAEDLKNIASYQPKETSTSEEVHASSSTTDVSAPDSLSFSDPDLTPEYTNFLKKRAALILAYEKEIDAMNHPSYKLYESRQKELSTIREQLLAEKKVVSSAKLPNEFEARVSQFMQDRLGLVAAINEKLKTLNNDTSKSGAKLRKQLIKDKLAILSAPDQVSLRAIVKKQLKKEIKRINAYANNTAFLLNVTEEWGGMNEKEMKEHKEDARKDMADMYHFLWFNDVKANYVNDFLHDKAHLDKEFFKRYQFFKVALHENGKDDYPFEANEQFKFRQAKQATLQFLHKERRFSLFHPRENRQLLKAAHQSTRQAKDEASLKAVLAQMKTYSPADKGIYGLIQAIKRRLSNRDHRTEVQKIENILAPKSRL